MMFTLSVRVGVGVSKFLSKDTGRKFLTGEASLMAAAAAKLSSVRGALNRQGGLGKGQARCASSKIKGIVLKSLIVTSRNLSQRC